MALAAMVPGAAPNAAAADGPPQPLQVLDLAPDLDVPAARFTNWMRARGWKTVLGSAEHFFVRDGRLHLVSRPGPVHRDRFRLAIFDRERLLEGLETKVLLQLTGEDFRADPARHPVIAFAMQPLELPDESADLRDSSRNDAAFYLLVSFDTERRDYHGYDLPLTVAYVWANRPWDQPVGRDPDYQAFLRYIPVGAGRPPPAAPVTVRRHLAADFRAAYPEEGAAPDIIRIALMIDSNTLGGEAETAVSRIRLAPAGQGSKAQN